MPPTPSDSGSEIARLLIRQGSLSQEQLAYAKRVKSKLSEQYSLLRVLRDLGYVSEGELRRTFSENRLKVRLGDLLVELGYLRESDLKAAIAMQKDALGGKKLGEILLDNHFIEEHKLIEVLADQLGFEAIEPRFADLEAGLVRRVNPRWCKEFQAIPVREEDGQVVVAFRDPLDGTAKSAAEQVFGPRVTPAIGSRRAIRDAILAFENASHANPRQVADESTVTGLVDSLVVDALDADASDIHIEPMKDHIRVRFRRDGVMMLHKDLDREMAQPLTSRLKIMAQADISERRRHQGGRVVFQDPRSGRGVDLRLSFYATIFGEKIVIRLLSRKAELLDVKEVGMAPRMLERFLQDALDLPSGVILITGPTGSGKTTTLYGCVNYLNDTEHSITTAEDPVEYVIDGIAQCSLNPKIGLTFEETLRHMVRQDPDVIVLGEVRDQYSAEAAIQAALTGHKVLTTFHTEDSIGGLLRLMNMNIETFLISSTVVSVLAQRLLRRVCPRCAENYTPTAHELRRLGYGQHELLGAKFRRGRGCTHCRYTGYSGRVGVFELLVLNETVKDAILNKRTSTEIRRISVETSGLITLLEDGIGKAAQGHTTIGEVLRHLPRLDRPRPLNEIMRLVGEFDHG